MHERSVVVGVTCHAPRPAAGEARRVNLRRSVIDAVVRAGGTPVLLPPTPGAAHAREHLRLCDAFLFTGGDDPRTEEFGVPTHPRATVMDQDRQAHEVALLRLLRDEAPRKPVLGVCLGMQLMALVAGGELNQCLEDDTATHADHAPAREAPPLPLPQVGGVVQEDPPPAPSRKREGVQEADPPLPLPRVGGARKREDPPPAPAAREREGVQEEDPSLTLRQIGSTLTRPLRGHPLPRGEGGAHPSNPSGDRVHAIVAEHPLLVSGRVNSWHRQAVRHAGSMRVVARAHDGVIEAIDDPSRPFYLGVQWHPERLADVGLDQAGPLGDGLFRELVKRAMG